MVFDGMGEGWGESNGSHPECDYKDMSPPPPKKEFQRKQKSHAEAYPVRDLEVLKIKKEEFLSRLRSDEDFLEMAHREWEKEIGVARCTLEKWMAGFVADGTMAKIVDGWRSQYDRFKPAIDLALIKKAKQGDTKAIELFYQKMEGWSVRQGMDLTVNKQYESLDNKDLMREMMKTMTVEEKQKLIDGNATDIAVVQ